MFFVIKTLILFSSERNFPVGPLKVGKPWNDLTLLKYLHGNQRVSNIRQGQITIFNVELKN